jgi:hypothetical protein
MVSKLQSTSAYTNGIVMNNIRAGSFLLAYVVSITGLTSFSDNVDGAWTGDPAGNQAGVGTLSTFLSRWFYLPSSSAGSKTLTMVGTTPQAICAWELVGAASFARSSGSNATGTNPQSGPAIAVDGEGMGICGCIVSSHITGPIGGGFTEDEGVAFGGNQGGHISCPSAVTVTPVFTGNGGSDWLMQCAAIAASGPDSPILSPQYSSHRFGPF